MFTANKYYRPNSAIQLNDGFLRVPQGVYFYQDFTISAWVKPYSYKSCARILEFSNTILPKQRRDLIIFCYTCMDGRPHFDIMNDTDDKWI